ncbi:3-phosphoshikimate 1-carboxyvinyltransferase [Candidatus Magnetobacterium bavaricum]|uniref:3-phosphoshikimate 1-carboxyvinyltransferase n=1 Tax=Candidatus Magnetobacterium bavaricum TaxID=29290 RepID=A0A0F3GT51_9BACT|nr:3-phosphoshikimate 1-carboxyvinyltransferase [Candidatus Magnetobacterium bavaricum]
MKNISLTRAKSGIIGEIVSPPDKSLSHRAVFIASMAKGVSVIKNFLMAGDPLSTVHAFSSLGVQIGLQQDGIEVHGCGLDGFSEPWNIIDCGNSGTTMRLLAGVLSSRPFFSVLTGDDSLRNRPMSRVILPLRQMNAEISARGNDRLPPIAIKGVRLFPIMYDMPVASAQVKSSVLFAGLSIDSGYTEVVEPVKSRDHTERMLGAFGADIRVDGLRVRVKGGAAMTGRDITLPGDFSSAAFFITAAIITEGSTLLIKQTGINPTRVGFLDVVREMGASVEPENVRDLCGEPTADLLCTFSGGLKAFNIGKDRVPSLIDEFPLLCLLATQAHGVSVIRGAKELRVKESDRISAMVLALESMGVPIEEYDDGVAIEGPVRLKGARIQSYNDHRIAMTLSIAALTADGETIIDGADAVEISFPDFYAQLNRLVRF